ncbi:hypothetical protein CYMTET_45707 [Cymbomonas tetramitiformis]|uniref:Uncharacterized protein n=1 Tax=Cymbomonas tetramitiformis TaxID=36881 RepID=A0AAE0BXP4_9CHLO|nr:hypothetical protein CYMTET_45707 [Cymbomonas tetramitiformis]
MAKRSYLTAADNNRTPTSKAGTAAKQAESTSGIPASRKTHSGYRHGNHPPGCTCSACRITGKQKRSADPSSSSPARKQHEGQSRRKEFTEAAASQPVALANQFDQLPPEQDEDMGQN